MFLGCRQIPALGFKRALQTRLFIMDHRLQLAIFSVRPSLINFLVLNVSIGALGHHDNVILRPFVEFPTYIVCLRQPWYRFDVFRSGYGLSLHHFFETIGITTLQCLCFSFMRFIETAKSPRPWVGTFCIFERDNRTGLALLNPIFRTPASALARHLLSLQFPLPIRKIDFFIKITPRMRQKLIRVHMQVLKRILQLFDHHHQLVNRVHIEFLKKALLLLSSKILQHFQPSPFPSPFPFPTLRTIPHS